MHAIETRGLTVKRGVKTIVDNVDLEVSPGEHTVLIGLNGCGKTTLLGAIAGYIGFSAGEVRLFGETMDYENTIALRKSVGFASSSFFNRIFSTESVLSIVLGAKFGAFSERWELTDEDVRRAKHLLGTLGLRKKTAYPYDTLSYGQRQRVLIARSLMVPPKLLVLDEPCNGLDVLARGHFLNTVAQIARESDATIVCATHYIDEIQGFYEKAVLMKDGKVFADGPVPDILSTEVLTQFYGQETICSIKDGFLTIEMQNQYCIPRDIWAK